MADLLVKVRFELDSSDWHGRGNELLWAAPVAAAPGCFCLANSPFFVTGISRLDVVEATDGEDRRFVEFSRVVERGGHSTYMLLVEAEDASYRLHWNMLKQKGCTYESAHIDLSIGMRLLLSVDVPPSADLHEVYRTLERGEAEGIWEFQEGYAYLPKQ